MTNIELRQARARIVHDMNEIASSVKPEDVEKYTRMDTEQAGLLAQIERIENASALDAEIRRTAAPPPPASGQQSEAEQRKAEHQRIFRNYLRLGGKQEGIVGSMSNEDRALLNKHYRTTLPKGDVEQRDLGEAGLGTGAATGAGVLVPVGFEHNVETALKYYGPMLDGGPGRPTIFPTATGQNLPWPTDNDTTVVGEQVGESQQVTMQDVTFGQITFGAWKYSSKLVKVSIELLQDSAFDLEAFLTDKFAIRLGRILNTKMTTGAGSTEPNGIITAATSGGTAVGAGSNDGSSAADTIGSDDLTTLEHSIDPWYRFGAQYMMHDSTLAALKKVKDKYGRPLWMTSIREGEPDRINGYMYSINNDMDQLQTVASSPTVTKKVLLFGQMPKYMIRRVREMSVLRLEERFAEFGQVAFLAFARYDGNLLDAGTHPVKYLQTVY